MDNQQNHLTSWHQTCFIDGSHFANIRTGLSEVSMGDGIQKDWRELCTAVVNETDSNKLSSLVQKLVEALDERRPNRRPRIDQCGENLESA